jgi:hypothetical protein
MEFDPRQRQRIFPLASVSRPALRPTQPPIQCYWVPFSGAKARPGRDADHSPPSSAKVQNEQKLYFLSPYRLHGGSGTDLLHFIGLYHSNLLQLFYLTIIEPCKHFRLLTIYVLLVLHVYETLLAYVTAVSYNLKLLILVI